MFEDLRAAFSEALDNFNKELSRDQVPETVDKLLVGMKNEIADEKAQVAGLGKQIEKTDAEIERLKDQQKTARRREEMAREIDDEETVRVAAEFATRAEKHLVVLEKKVIALREELAFRENSLEHMFARFHEAKEKRDALASTSGRSGARETISAADDLFGELDRMAEKIEGEKAAGDAAEAFDALDFDEPSEFHVDIEEAPRREELDVDAALEELKRRMGES